MCERVSMRPPRPTISATVGAGPTWHSSIPLWLTVCHAQGPSAPAGGPTMPEHPTAVRSAIAIHLARFIFVPLGVVLRQGPTAGVEPADNVQRRVRGAMLGKHRKRQGPAVGNPCRRGPNTVCFYRDGLPGAAGAHPAFFTRLDPSRFLGCRANYLEFGRCFVGRQHPKGSATGGPCGNRVRFTIGRHLAPLKHAP